MQFRRSRSRSRSSKRRLSGPSDENRLVDEQPDHACDVPSLTDLLSQVLGGETDQEALDAVRRAVDLGVAVTSSVNGYALAHHLAKTRKAQTLQFLVEQQCDVNGEVPLLRQTPLFFAASQGPLSMVRDLLLLKADPHHQDNCGRTALSWAAHLETAEALVNACGEAGLAVEPLSSRARAQDVDVAEFFRAVKKVRDQAARLCWNVRRQAAEDASRPLRFYSYLVLRCRAPDFKQYDMLEEEFVEDHSRMLGTGYSRTRLCELLGHEEDVTKRKQWFRDLISSSNAGETRQSMLACIYDPCDGKEEQVVGFLYFWITTQDGLVTVSHLKVSKKHQRKGIAKLLLGAMLTSLAQQKDVRPQKMTLMVVARNVEAVTLYKSLGFEVQPGGAAGYASDDEKTLKDKDEGLPLKVAEDTKRDKLKEKEYTLKDVTQEKLKIAGKGEPEDDAMEGAMPRNVVSSDVLTVHPKGSRVPRDSTWICMGKDLSAWPTPASLLSLRDSWLLDLPGGRGGCAEEQAAA